MTVMTASELVVIDSSGWLEYLTGDTKHDLFAPYFAAESRICVAMMVLHEVGKVLLARASKNNEFVAAALQLRLIPVDSAVALSAAALDRKATLITSDSHVQDLPGVITL